MIRLVVPLAAPSWLHSFAQSIERAFREQTLPEHKSDALPPPNRGGQIYVADIPAVAFSDGTNWIRTDTGAPL